MKGEKVETDVEVLQSGTGPEVVQSVVELLK